MTLNFALDFFYFLPMLIVGFFFIFPAQNIWVRVLILFGSIFLLAATEVILVKHGRPSVDQSQDQYNRNFPKAPY